MCPFFGDYNVFVYIPAAVFCVHFLIINVFVYIPAAAVSFFLRLNMEYFDYRFDFDVSNSCNLIILYHET